MIKITPAAAEQIRKSAAQSNAQGLCLRLAAAPGQDGGFEYAMGYDEKKDSDTLILSEGIEVILSSQSRDFFMGASLDYVEINPGEHRFIFNNPNDPTHGPATVARDS